MAAYSFLTRGSRRGGEALSSSLWWLLQNHRMDGIGRDLRMPPGPTHLQGNLLKVGNLHQCSVTCTVNNCFLMFRHNLLSFNLWTLPLVLSLGITERSQALSSLCSPLVYLYTSIQMNPQILSSLDWRASVLLAFPPRTDASGPLSSLWPFVGISPGHSIPGAKEKGRNTPPWPAAMLCLMQPTYLLSSFLQGHSAGLWSAWCPPTSFSAKLLPRWVAPNIYIFDPP